MNLETSINIRLDKQTRKTLEKMAEADDRKLSDFIRLVLQQHVRTPMRVKKGRAA